MLFADLSLARRLERAEGMSNRRFVEARARTMPARGAAWMEVAGAYAMFDGATSPLTQTFGLGMSQPVTESDLAAIEAFFTERGAATHHEVCPLADGSALAQLNARRYQPFELTNVLYRPLAEGVALEGALGKEVTVRTIAEGEQDLWARTAATGWSDLPELEGFMLEMGQVFAAAEDVTVFLAEAEGQAIATGALCIHAGVALLAGASTVPAGRRRGAQLALLSARLHHAVERGCDVAVMSALPGSGSQRNAERHGFRVAYTRTKWRKG